MKQAPITDECQSTSKQPSGQHSAVEHFKQPPMPACQLAAVHHVSTFVYTPSPLDDVAQPPGRPESSQHASRCSRLQADMRQHLRAGAKSKAPVPAVRCGIHCIANRYPRGLLRASGNPRLASQAMHGESVSAEEGESGKLQIASRAQVHRHPVPQLHACMSSGTSSFLHNATIPQLPSNQLQVGAI